MRTTPLFPPLLLCVLLAMANTSAAHTETTNPEDIQLFYTKPAPAWVEALPIGNSRLGVMVSGGTAHEELQLNEAKEWGGGTHRNA